MNAFLTRNPIVLPVYAPTMLLAIGSGMLAPILPLYAASFGASYGMIGLVLGIRGLGTILGDIPAGLLLRRMGQRRLMIIGLICIALCGLAMSTAQALWMLIVYGLVEGIGGALWNISRHAFPPRRDAAGADPTRSHGVCVRGPGTATQPRSGSAACDLSLIHI